MKESEKESSNKAQYQINKKYQYSADIQSKASLLSKIFFLWTHKLIQKGSQKHLQMDDLYDINQSEQPSYSYSIFSQIYNQTRENSNKVYTSMKNFIFDKFVLAGLLAAISHSLLLVGPIMIKNILIFIQKKQQPLIDGIWYVTILISSYIFRAFLLQHALHMVNTNSIKILNGNNSLIYHKILNLSASSMKYLETGVILNYINVDTNSCIQFINLSPYLFIGPFMISIAIILLVVQVGWLGFIVPLFFLLGTYWQEKLLSKGYQIRKNQLKLLDKRSKCINQYFSGIRIIKYYGWQNFVWDNIQKIRKQEIIQNFAFLIVRTYIEMLIKMLPTITSIFIFGMYTSLQGGQSFTLAKGFAILSIFNLINNPLRLLVSVSIHYMNTKASINRIQHFCEFDEKRNYQSSTGQNQLKKGQISFVNCKFIWDDEIVKLHSQKQGQNKNKSKQRTRKKLLSFMDRKSQNSQSPTMKMEAPLLDPINQDEDFNIQLKQLKSSDKKNSLEIKNLKINTGEFVAVVGRVASGKTTFLHSILSEIKKKDGKFKIKGSIAYVPQVSWLRSTTIKQNILFESPYQQSRYKQIIKLCELQTDFQVLKGGDMTEIGQKGLNLSGGQKQRISLARALYQDCDIYLIDDCLSALDSYVGKNIFKNVLSKYLKNKGKTIVLVTNALNYTDSCERVLVLHKGMIVEDGNPKNLVQNKQSTYYSLKQQYKKLLEDQQNQKRKLRASIQKRRTTSIDLSEISFNGDKIQQQLPKKQLQGLVKVQERLKGSIPWSFYFRFYTQTRFITSITLFLFILLCQLARVGNDYWLGQWTQNAQPATQNYYLGIYTTISLVVCLLMFLRGLFFAKFIIRTSKFIHRKLINSLLKSPLSWFDVTPTGRILARTIKDQYQLDNTLPYNLQNSSQNLLVLLSAIILITLATPGYIFIAAFSFYAYSKLMKKYLNASRQIKRLEANCRAPLMSHIQETINGIYVIRAFNKTDIFIKKFFEKQKAHVVTISNQNMTERWINLCTECFSILTIACAGYFGVLDSNYSQSHENLTMVGLALVWTIQMSSIMPHTIKMLADTQNSMNSLVRMYDYVDNNPSQYSFEKPVPLSNNWPDLGQYTVQNVSYKYRPQLNFVIKNISFKIQPMSKVGIVGRTGSGKSSITLGLLRILQISENEDGTKGSIFLDEENVSNLGLHYLRHNITMIPQDPTLFTGTIRSNIDPFNNYTQNQIAYSLKRVKLWDQIPTNLQYKDQIDQKIYSKVQEAGSNYSLGQKQLICMARALIRKPKILIMDEATASIDEKTDEDIQNMIRQEFNETTVITIAHRLNTLIYYDKILVLDKGQIMEYDTPLNLVKNQNSFLGKIIRKTGYNFMKDIIQLAEKSAKAKQKRQKQQ